MSPDTQILLSGALTFGVPLALAARELVALRRPRSGGHGPPDNPPEPAPLKPLPDCLVPGPRPRVLEDA